MGPAGTACIGATCLRRRIVAAGQSGLIIGLALKREGVCNVLLLDRNPAGYEGPWETFARMAVLRSPKAVVGAELDIPSLSVRAWFEARYGAEAWERITWIPRSDWMRYLRWYRGIADLDIFGRRHRARGSTAGAEDGRPGELRYGASAPRGAGDWPGRRRHLERPRDDRARHASLGLRSFQ